MISLTVKNEDLSSAKCYATLEDVKGNLVTKSGSAVSVSTSGSDSVLTFRLTQQESLSLHEGTINVQVKWITSNNRVGGTGICPLVMDRALLKEVITYG